MQEVVNSSNNEYFDPRHNMSSIAFGSGSGGGGSGGKNNVYCTANFIATVANKNDDSPSPSEEYLRPVDAVLWLPRDQAVVLLSEREADKILPILAAAEKSASATDMAQSDRPRFLNLNYLRLSHTDPSTSVSLKWSTVADFPTDLLVQLQLFSGETAYPTTAHQAALTALLSSGDGDKVKAAQSAALVLPVLRGLHFMVSRSDLEVICTRLNI
jgi:hypothetical protein